MKLPSLDLNLVVVLHALLAERNVTRAGERVGLSQPGASAALARLRRYFGDPLLVRVANQYMLTPLAQGLAGQVEHTLEDLQRVLAVRPDFDPATAQRSFTIVCSDSVLTVLAARIVATVTAQAPDVVLDFRSPRRETVDHAETVLQEVDLLITPHGVFSLPGVPHETLYEDRWLCVASADNTRIGDRLTPEQAADARWALPYHEMLMASPADAALAAHGINRNGAVRVEFSFTLLGGLVARTPLLALLHERTAGDLAAAGLRPVELPFELPPIVEVAWSHPSRMLDPGHRWLVETVVREARMLPPISRPDAPQPRPGFAPGFSSSRRSSSGTPSSVVE